MCLYLCVCVYACLFGNLRMLIRHSENSLKCLLRQHCPSPAGPLSLVATLLLRTSLTALLSSCLPMRSRHAAFAFVVVLLPLSNVFQSHDRVCEGERERERTRTSSRTRTRRQTRLTPTPASCKLPCLCVCIAPCLLRVLVRACVSPVCVCCDLCVLRFVCVVLLLFFFYHLSGCACGAACCCCLLWCCLLLPSSYRTTSARMNKT